MIQVNYTKNVIEELNQRGYKHKKWRHGALGSAVYIGTPHQKPKVVIKTIEVPPPSIQPLHASVDDYFRRLQSLLVGIISALGPVDLFLPGGGSIPVPSWFQDWCRDNQVHIEICEGDRLPRIN